MKKEIPKEILALAKEELDWLKAYKYPHAGEMKCLGRKDYIDYYTPIYSDDLIIGYPTVYSINIKGICAVHHTSDALAIINLFCKD